MLVQMRHTSHSGDILARASISHYHANGYHFADQAMRLTVLASADILF